MTAGYLNRQNGSGEILSFRKDGATVGSIGTLAAHLYFAGSTLGLNLRAILFMAPIVQGSALDNTIDIGASSYRFKDPLPSGGVYLGGTGSANHLDDYETGTYNPTFVPAGGSFTNIPFASDGQFGRYTIVGNRCYFEIKLETEATGVSVGTASGALFVSLPLQQQL